MSKQKQQERARAKAERKKLSNKASAVRAKLKAGKEATEQEKALLMEWNQQKAPPKTPPKDEPEEFKADPAKAAAPEAKPAELPSEPSVLDKIAGAAADVLTAGNPIAAGAVQGIGKPPPGPIPKVTPSKLGKSGWQNKYKFDTGENREEACLELSALWVKGLKRLNADIRDLGGTPLVKDALIETLLKDAMVLTCDKFLPEDLSLDPVIMSAVGTTFVSGQRVYQGRTAKAKALKADGENARVLSFVQPDRPKPTPKPKVTAARYAAESESAAKRPRDIADYTPPKKEPEPMSATKDEHKPASKPTVAPLPPARPAPKFDVPKSGPVVEDHDFSAVGPDGKLPPC